LHATRLQEVASDAAALVDSSIPLLDTTALVNNIKIGLTINPLAKRELDCCVANNPSPHFLLAATGLLLLDCHVYVPDYQPNQGNLHTQALQEKHNHPTAGHFSFNKTLELLQHDYIWPSMCIDCKKYVSQCMLCACNEPSRHHPYGLLQPLPIPEHPWHSISMDFIKQHPPSNRYTAILVIINQLLKESIFIPTTDSIMSVEVAEAFITHVFAKHRIPLHISSDCGSEFTSHFFHSLGSLLCMNLHFTLGHHPLANGQVEHLNSMLEQYLCIYCNYEQDSWSKLLPLAEFAYNNTPHSSTGISPFFATCRYDPLIAVYPNTEITDLRACHFTVNFNKHHKFLCDHMKEAQETMAHYMNQDHLTPPPFCVGDQVYVHTDHICMNRSARKLAE